MMRKVFAAGALALAAAAPASAAVFSLDLTNAVSVAVPGDNDFVNELNDLDLGSYVSSGVGLSLTGDASVDFYYLGSESYYANSFVTSGFDSADSGIETSTGIEGPYFNSPIYIGTVYYSGGSITDWVFKGNPNGDSAIGSAGFAFFLSSAADVASLNATSLVLGYDDDAPNDDNHDDLFILAQISAVPESSTWAMLLAGFATVGAALRRGRRPTRMVQAV